MEWIISAQELEDTVLMDLLPTSSKTVSSNLLKKELFCNEL